MAGSNKLTDDPLLKLSLWVVGLFLALGLVVALGMIVLPILAVFGIAKAIHWYVNLPEKTYKVAAAVEDIRTRAEFPDPHEFFEAFALRYEKDCKDVGVTPAGYNTLKEIYTLAIALYQAEGLHERTSPLRGVIEGSVQEGEYRDRLMEQAKKAQNPAKTMDAFTRVLSSAFVGFTTCLPPQASEVYDRDGVESHKGISIFVMDLMDEAAIKQAVEYLAGAFFRNEALELNLFSDLRMQLEKNLEAIDAQDIVLATEFKGTKVETIDAYLNYTDLMNVFAAQVPWTLPEDMRFEHQWIVAPQGAGKTQLIQHQLARDIEAVVKGEASVVVMDSQGDLINLISGLKAMPMEKLVIIEPDPTYPIALNLFDLGRSREGTYDERTREMLDTNALDLLTQVFDTLLGTGTTPKQSTLFRHAIRLCRLIPGATIHTLTDILNTDNVPHPEYVAKLPKVSRDFFEGLFTDKKQFAQTKQEVAWRLSLMLENSTFERMFSQKKSKIDLFTELNSSKLILINTDKSLLKDQGTELFGRFFIAMLLQAAQERAAIARSKRLPTYIYIDECQDYIAHDTNITTILDQARKMKVGMVLAHQRTAQLDAAVLDAVTNVSIKCARAVNDSGAHLLARNMGTKPEFIASQPVGHFAISLRNEPAASIKIPAFVMEKMPRISDGDMAVLKHRMREKYSVRYTPTDDATPPPEPVVVQPRRRQEPPIVPLDQIPEADINSPPERPSQWPMA